jgi:hypothetical protein
MAPRVCGYKRLQWLTSHEYRLNLMHRSYLNLTLDLFDPSPDAPTIWVDPSLGRRRRPSVQLLRRDLIHRLPVGLTDRRLGN